ncbi:unnamed protein product [Ectocarpus sp. 12 AP-2014]
MDLSSCQDLASPFAMISAHVPPCTPGRLLHLLQNKSSVVQKCPRVRSAAGMPYSPMHDCMSFKMGLTCPPCTTVDYNTSEMKKNCQINVEGREGGGSAANMSRNINTTLPTRCLVPLQLVSLRYYAYLR